MENVTTSGSDYRNFKPGAVPCTHSKLVPYVLATADQNNVCSVLDIGCGQGSMCQALVKEGRRVVGIDPSSVGIEIARADCEGADFHVMSIYDAPESLEQGDFDMAIATEVVEHLFYPRELMRFARCKLKTGGMFLVSTPYHGWLKNLLISALGKWDKHHTVLWDGGHIKFWSRATLGKLFEEEGFEVVQFYGCGRVAFLWESMILVGRKR